MDITKIEFSKKSHPFDPLGLVIRGEYRASMELTILRPTDKQAKDEAKKLIHDSIERQASHDILGVSFARSLDEETRQLIISSMVQVNSMWQPSEQDKKQRTNAYKEFKMREQLIYELRSKNFTD